MTKPVMKCRHCGEIREYGGEIPYQIYNQHFHIEVEKCWDCLGEKNIKNPIILHFIGNDGTDLL